MTVALILLGALAGVGLLLYLTHRPDSAPEAENMPEETAADGDGNGDGDSDACCGMHITCERDSLLAAVSAKVEYYDDEELDRYARRAPETYSEAEIEEFRDVLLTTRPDDIAGWARSLQLREITLPAAVRDELLMIVSEARAARTHN